MALPLLWLGAAALSALTVKELSDDRKTVQRNRNNSYQAKTLADLAEHESPIAVYPSDAFIAMNSHYSFVEPTLGAIVCCGIAGVLDHTGIWVGDNTIVELDGNGLIKPISHQRFLHERSGEQIFILCDSLGTPLALELAGEKALKQIFQSIDYHFLDNNCHQFVWQCYQNINQPGNLPNTHQTTQVTTFKQLNIQLATLFNRVLYWDVMEMNPEKRKRLQTEVIKHNKYLPSNNKSSFSQD